MVEFFQIFSSVRIWRTPCKLLAYPQGYAYPRLRIAALANFIQSILLSVYLRPNVIILSGFHCIVLWKKRVYPNTSQAAYPNEESFSSSSNFCLLLKKLVRNCDGDRKQSLSFKYPTLCSEVWREENEIYRLDCKTFEEDLEIEQVVFYCLFCVADLSKAICLMVYVLEFIWKRLIRTLWCRV